MFKKILFPFFNKDRHGFLKNKIWFRSMIVTYVIALVIIFILFAKNQIDLQYYCYDLYYRIDDIKMYKCYREYFWNGIALGSIVVAITHYILQFTFLKIIIDYIFLGDNKNK